MRAVRVDSFGSIEKLHVVHIEEPQPGIDQVLVRVEACGLNFADILQRRGLYHAGPIPPYFAGIEASGIVVAVGSGVRSISNGARVAMIGSCAMHGDMVVTPANLCIAIPDSIPLDIAAAFPVHFLCAYHALTTVAHAQPGETVLIHAAAGGLGAALVQLARLLSLRIIGTASSIAKRDWIISCGADQAYDYVSFEKGAKDFTHGAGPDIIVDSIGGDVFRRSFRLLAPWGRIVVVGSATPDPRSIDMTRLLFDSKSVLGLHIRSLLTQPERLVTSSAELLQWIVADQIRPYIGRVFALDDVREAHALMESRTSRGKIILIP